MAAVVKKFYQGQPQTGSAQTLYTCGVSNAMIKEITLTNTTGTAATITIHVVPAAAGVGTPNRIISTKSIAANDCLIVALSTGMVLNDFVAGVQVTTNAISVGISGVEF